MLDVDGQLFDLGALADLILAQPLLGSTVKVDGNETDPYAFLTVLNLHEHKVGGFSSLLRTMCLTNRKEHPAVRKLVDYLVDRAATTPDLAPLGDLLKSSDTTQVGLVLTERLINIPADVVPPMYKMLEEEISWALEEKEPYNFTHYLVISKTYQEVESNFDHESGKIHKRKKQKSGTNNNSVPSIFYFHPEDEVLQRHAKLYGGFRYIKQQGEGQSDSKRTFQELGIRPQGHLMLIEAEKFGPAVKALEQYLSQT